MKSDNSSGGRSGYSFLKDNQAMLNNFHLDFSEHRIAIYSKFVPLGIILTNTDVASLEDSFKLNSCLCGAIET